MFLRMPHFGVRGAGRNAASVRGLSGVESYPVPNRRPKSQTKFQCCQNEIAIFGCFTCPHDAVSGLGTISQNGEISVNSKLKRSCINFVEHFVETSRKFRRDQPEISSRPAGILVEVRTLYGAAGLA